MRQGACLSSGMPSFFGSALLSDRWPLRSAGRWGKQKQGLLRAGMVKRLPRHWLEHSHMAAPSSKGSWERCGPFPAGRGDSYGEHLASLPGPFPAQRFYNLGIFHFTAPTFLIPLYFSLIQMSPSNRGLFISCVSYFLLVSPHWHMETTKAQSFGVLFTTVSLGPWMGPGIQKALNICRKKIGWCGSLACSLMVRARSALDRRSVSRLPTRKPVLGGGEWPGLAGEGRCV